MSKVINIPESVQSLDNLLQLLVDNGADPLGYYFANIQGSKSKLFMRLRRKAMLREIKTIRGKRRNRHRI